MAPVGAIFGGPIAGWIADFLGRKVALLLVAIPYLSGYMMITYAHFIYNPVGFKTVLFLGRFLTGIGVGWSCLATPVSDISVFIVVLDQFLQGCDIFFKCPVSRSCYNV